jgi:ABC-type transport system involved in multi-copper enzyme maturation permease subunit
MTKVIQAFLTGIFFTFILDFFLFLGIKLHYIDYYKIDVYYNILFADHQNIIVYLLMTAFIGYLTIYYARPKTAAAVLAGLFAAVLLTLAPPIGKAVGALLLLEKNQTLQDARYSYHGDIFYNDREHIYIYDDELQELLNLSKKDLKK